MTPWTALIAENTALRARVERLRAAVDLVTKYAGCGDNSCLFIKPSGMATNGGCRCVDRGGGRPFVAQALANLYKAVLAAIHGETK